MTTEERFERFESGMAAIVELQRIQSENLSTVIQTLGAFITSSDARMKRLEDNLELLIRAMTTEHSNGKAH